MFRDGIGRRILNPGEPHPLTEMHLPPGTPGLERALRRAEGIKSAPATREQKIINAVYGLRSLGIFFRTNGRILANFRDKDFSRLLVLPAQESQYISVEFVEGFLPRFYYSDSGEVASAVYSNRSCEIHKFFDRELYEANIEFGATLPINPRPI